jgi:hypothetical protein
MAFGMSEYHSFDEIADTNGRIIYSGCAQEAGRGHVDGPASADGAHRHTVWMSPIDRLRWSRDRRPHRPGVDYTRPLARRWCATSSANCSIRARAHAAKARRNHHHQELSRRRKRARPCCAPRAGRPFRCPWRLAIATEDPQFEGDIYVARNITERKRAERRIRYWRATTR